jgi:hypothetical protein
MSLVLPTLFARSEEDVEDSATHGVVFCELPSVSRTCMSPHRETNAHIQPVQLIFKARNVAWWRTEENLWQIVHDYTESKDTSTVVYSSCFEGEKPDERVKKSYQIKNQRESSESTQDLNHRFSISNASRCQLCLVKNWSKTMRNSWGIQIICSTYTPCEELCLERNRWKDFQNRLMNPERNCFQLYNTTEEKIEKIVLLFDEYDYIQ